MIQQRPGAGAADLKLGWQEGGPEALRVSRVCDLHHALKRYSRTMAVAPEFDTVVIVGDHLSSADQVDGSAQVVVILKYLRRWMDRTRIIVPSGDLDSRDLAGTAQWMRRLRQMGMAADGVMPGEDNRTACYWTRSARCSVRASIRLNFMATPTTLIGLLLPQRWPDLAARVDWSLGA